MSALVGGLFGKSALAVDDKISEHYKTFTAALSAIEANYVDKVESDNLVYSAIRGMLAHSIRTRASFDRAEYARRCASGRKGGYYGIGIQIVAADGDITATRVFEGSPALQARAFAAATSSPESPGERRQGLDCRSRRWQKLARPKGTTVEIEIKRRGYEQLIPIRAHARRGATSRRCRRIS